MGILGVRDLPASIWAFLVLLRDGRPFVACPNVITSVRLLPLSVDC